MSAAVESRRDRIARAMYEATEWSGCDGASWDRLVAPYPQRLRRWHELADAVIAVDGPSGSFVDVVFDGPPGRLSGRFVEVEAPDGRSLNVGAWIERPGTHFWALRIPLAEHQAEVEQLRAKVELLEFNLRTPVGTAVRFWPGAQEGEGRTSRTASTAWMLGETPVALVEGYSGGVALSHIEVVR